jgi:glycosyltransferase involved in cell wall biosynthesis
MALICLHFLRFRQSGLRSSEDGGKYPMDIPWWVLLLVTLNGKEFNILFRPLRNLLCCTGPFHPEIVKLTADLHRQVTFIPFEEDIAALYRVFDLYVHTPVDSSCEAFGQTYIEALASGIPSIFTLSGVAAECMVHHHNAWIVDFKDEQGILDGLIKLWTSPGIRQQIVRNGKQTVLSQFGLSPMLTKLKELYNE